MARTNPRRWQPYLRSATRAALAAGELLVEWAGRARHVKTKRSAIDLVTEVDRRTERLIDRRLRRDHPEVGFLGEEHGHRPAPPPQTLVGGRAPSPSRWIVDPIDGTINFVHGLPLFGVSIALEHRGTVVAGVIYDPMRRELFAATQGGGAFRNGQRIHVSTAAALGRSLLSTGFSSMFTTRSQPYLRWFETFQRHSHGVRRIGSTVFSLASVAAGRLEGFYERDLWPWDIAAGMLLVTEAGGRVSDFRGRAPALDRGQLVASNGRIHAQMLRVLR